MGGLQGGQTAAVFQKRGEHGHAHGELAGLFQGAEQVVAHEIEARHRHERHVAHARDAVLVQITLEGAVGVQQLLAREFRHDARHELHGCRLAHNARKVPVGVFVVAPACGRLAFLRDAQAFQRAAVQPQGVGVAGVHGHGSVGVGSIQRRAARHAGRVPQVVAPALGEQPRAGRSPCGQGRQARYRVGLVLAHEALSQRGEVQRGVEVMKMGVVEARHHESVSVVDDFGIGAAQMLGQDFKRAGPQNAVAPDGHGSGRGLVVGTGKQGRGNEDSISGAGSCHGASPSEGERVGWPSDSQGRLGFSGAVYALK